MEKRIAVMPSSVTGVVGNYAEEGGPKVIPTVYLVLVRDNRVLLSRRYKIGFSRCKGRGWDRDRFNGFGFGSCDA